MVYKNTTHKMNIVHAKSFRSIFFLTHLKDLKKFMGLDAGVFDKYMESNGDDS